MRIFFIIIIILVPFYIIRKNIIKKKKDKLKNIINANNFIQTLNKLIEENKYNLLEERIRLKNTDAYGIEDLNKWIGNPPLDEKIIEKSLNQGSKAQTYQLALQR